MQSKTLGLPFITGAWHVVAKIPAPNSATRRGGCAAVDVSLMLLIALLEPRTRAEDDAAAVVLLVRRNDLRISEKDDSRNRWLICLG